MNNGDDWLDKKRNRIILYVILCLILVLIIVWLLVDFVFRPYIRRDNQKWETGAIENETAKEFLPKKEEVSGCICYDFFTKTPYYPFSFRMDQLDEAYLLELTYSEETFQSELEKVLSNYEFVQEPFVPTDDIPCSEGVLGNFTFKVVSNKAPNMIAWNRDTQKIRYVSIEEYSLSGYSSKEMYTRCVKNSFRVKW